MGSAIRKKAGSGPALNQRGSETLQVTISKPGWKKKYKPHILERDLNGLFCYLCLWTKYGLQSKWTRWLIIWPVFGTARLQTGVSYLRGLKTSWLLGWVDYPSIVNGCIPVHAKKGKNVEFATFTYTKLQKDTKPMFTLINWRSTGKK
jgi:hypothetical protein